MLAIVIPYYKINYFEETLKSLSNQTDKRFKVYIGNDASENDPEEIIEKYSSTLNLVYKKFNDNLGSISLVQQWNRCLELLEDEEWVMILGDDDVLSENFVEQFYDCYPDFDRKYDVIRFGVFKINEDGKTFSSFYENPKIESSKKILFCNKRSSLSEYVFKKSKVASIGFKNFPLGWWSDVLAILEFSNFGNIYSINSSHVFVRISSSSISGSQKLDDVKDKAKFLFYNYLIKKSNDKFSKDELNELYNRIFKTYWNNKKNNEFLIETLKMFSSFRALRLFLKFIFSKL